MAQIRFQKGGAYDSDIRSLRDAIRANAVNVNCVAVSVIHPKAQGQPPPVFYLNMAYQANSQMPPASASLYIVAFRNGAGAGFRFNLPAFVATFSNPPLVPHGAPAFAALASDGSYGTLGSAHQFPNINDANLATAVTTVANYAGGDPNAPMQAALVRLVIALSEAVRFGSVETGVAGVLGTGGTFNPPWDQIHAWGGHTLG